MPKLICAIDDEEDILDALSIVLKKEQYAFKGFSNPSKLLDFIKTHTPDLFILDIMLPDTDGFEICRQIRKNRKFDASPIIFLSAKSDEVDKVLGLELGADDYITKPFSPKELAARVKAVLRRNNSPSSYNNVIEIDKDSREIIVDGKKISATFTEFKILELLFAKKGKVFSRDEILDYIWGQDKIVVDRTIDVHIKNLRDKIGKYGKSIKNIRSIGYKFEI
jgi:two-component system phosphate regulon response regulator PhoB/two-component system alkaline phosphatase synthesis response regulator PhoP